MTTEELTIEVQKHSKKLDLFELWWYITLISIEDDKHVKRLEGACTSCSVNQMTLRAGVETTIKNLLHK
jgi:hypothetical protein